MFKMLRCERCGQEQAFGYEGAEPVKWTCPPCVSDADRTLGGVLGPQGEAWRERSEAHARQAVKLMEIVAQRDEQIRDLDGALVIASADIEERNGMIARAETIRERDRQFVAETKRLEADDGGACSRDMYKLARDNVALQYSALLKENDALRAEIMDLKAQKGLLGHRAYPTADWRPAPPDAPLCEWCRQPAVNDDLGVCCDTRRRKDELARRKVREAHFQSLSVEKARGQYAARTYALLAWLAATITTVMAASRLLGVVP